MEQECGACGDSKINNILYKHNLDSNHIYLCEDCAINAERNNYYPLYKKNNTEITQEIKKTLRDIFCYLGIDENNANNATLHRYIESLIRRLNE